MIKILVLTLRVSALHGEAWMRIILPLCVVFLGLGSACLLVALRRGMTLKHIVEPLPVDAAKQALLAPAELAQKQVYVLDCLQTSLWKSKMKPIVKYYVY